MSDQNRQLRLRKRPTGEVADEHFELVESPIQEPGPGEVLLRTIWLSFDPAQRGWLNDVRSYVPPVALGEVMRAYGIGEVVAPNADGVAVGDLVNATVGWQEYAVVDPSSAELFEPVPANVPDPEMMLGVLGITGLTAYFGMTDIGRPVVGDIVLVTAAAGVTGSIAGQIARIKGVARVIGTAGADEKRRWVRDVAGFDECLCHYDDDIRRQLRTTAAAGSTWSSTTSAARCSTPRCSTSPSAPASCCAVRSRPVTDRSVRGRAALLPAADDGSRPDGGLHRDRSRRAAFAEVPAPRVVAPWSAPTGRLRPALRQCSEGLRVGPPEGSAPRCSPAGNLGKQLLRTPVAPSGGTAPARGSGLAWSESSGARWVGRRTRRSSRSPCTCRRSSRRRRPCAACRGNGPRSSCAGPGSPLRLVRRVVRQRAWPRCR